ncbi:hypothetical protein ACJRO7_004465 [Eucalyptus globulus]|uniref:Uncharacterized protein n=1 Tax=Eucalyptus globulus TaxID=34317 RepID=A0ABD3J1C6_EUCGL
MIATMDSDEEKEIEFEEDEKVRVVKEAGVPVAVDEDGEEMTRKKRRKMACKARSKQTVKEMGTAAWATRTTARKSRTTRTTRTTVGYRPTKAFFSISSSYFDLACCSHGQGFVSDLELAVGKMKTKTKSLASRL